MRTMLRWVVVCAATAIIAGCNQYAEPPPPSDVLSMTTRSREMAWSGIDYAGTGTGRMQRNGTSGVNSDTNDDLAQPLDREVVPEGLPSGSGPFRPEMVTEAISGPGPPNPSPHLDVRAATPGFRVR